MKKIELGFSIYLNLEKEKNEYIINNYSKIGMKYVFTSLLNFEDKSINKKDLINNLINLCIKKNLILIIDINMENIEYISKNISNIYYRIDDGFSLDEIYEFSKYNNIVLNSSVLNIHNLEYLKNKGINFSKIYSLHNFYPKKYTGLDIEYIRKQNIIYNSYGIKTMAFVKGDELRGPVYEGLVTVEEHRNLSILESILQLYENNTDIILVGDIFINKENLLNLNYLNKGVIPLKNKDNILLNIEFKDRLDSSSYVIRNSVTNRVEFKHFIQENIKIRENKAILKGDILVSNEKYKRYEGELEIAIKDLGIDDKRDIVSKIIPKDIPLLKYVYLTKKFIFINNK